MARARQLKPASCSNVEHACLITCNQNLHGTLLQHPHLARQLDVAERGDKSYTGARDYAIGIADKHGNVECDPTFYLMATSGLYRGEIPLILQDELSTNWIGYIAIGPYVDDVAKRDIVVAFRGTQVPYAQLRGSIRALSVECILAPMLCAAAVRASPWALVSCLLSRFVLAHAAMEQKRAGASKNRSAMQGLPSTDSGSASPYL